MKLYNELVAQLTKEPDFVSDNGEFKKWVVSNRARNYDGDLIKLLLQNDTLKQTFFKDVDGVLIFMLDKFLLFIEQKNYLKDSFTSYKNKIGLTIGGKFLNQHKEVELVWPYKDCILEGGQTKEDAKRDEIFFNETLAQDEITTLLDQKVLTNYHRYGKVQSNAPFFNRDAAFNESRGLAKDTITDNLVIKGNNLIALHCLKKEFAGKVKMIYIDPPYNTGNDSFGYNDSFNHSTWLTFMKNRLEIAHSLLKDDGAIFVQIDSKELSYLQVIMNQIFKRENFKNIITIQRSAISGPKVINPGVVNVSEYILVYSKSKNWRFNRAYAERARDSRYGLFIENLEDDYSNWRFIPLLDAFTKQKGKDLKTLKKEIGDSFEESVNDFVIDNINHIVRFANLDENTVSAAATEIKKQSKENQDCVLKLERNNKPPYYVFNGQVILFYKDRVREIDGKLCPSEPVSDIWTDVLPNDLHNEGGVDFKKGKKTEKLISRIIEIGTDKHEIVLDFFGGSGTTAATAHKMERQYIIVEQMDNQINMITKRLENVMQGEQRGISKAVKWNPKEPELTNPDRYARNNFVYFELKKFNQAFIEKIEAAESTETLLHIFDEMKEKSFLAYNLDIKEQNERLEEFKALNLDEQKQILCGILDKNQLYVNRTDIADTRFENTAEEIAVTNEFYSK